MFYRYTINILPDISKSKDNQTMRFCQLIVEHNLIKISIQRSLRKWGEESSPRLLFGFKKAALHEVKTNAQHLGFNVFWQSSMWTHNKNELYKNSDCWSKNILNFYLSKKGLELVSSPHLVHDFSKKKCFSCYVLFTVQTSLSDCFYFLGYLAICIL